VRQYAKFSPRLWSGDLGRSLRGDHLAQALASYLISAPGSNSIGLYYLPMGHACADLGCPLEGASEALGRLSEGGFCRYDQAREVVWVVGAARHEWPAGLKPTDKNVAGVLRLLGEHHKSFLVSEFLSMYADHLSLPSEAVARPFGGPSEGLRRGIPQEQEQEQEQENGAAGPAPRVLDLRPPSPPEGPDPEPGGGADRPPKRKPTNPAAERIRAIFAAHGVPEKLWPPWPVAGRWAKEWNGDGGPGHEKLFEALGKLGEQGHLGRGFAWAAKLLETWIAYGGEEPPALSGGRRPRLSPDLERRRAGCSEESLAKIRAATGRRAET
jgi:hypothetical protein